MLRSSLWFIFMISGFTFLWMFLGYPLTLWLLDKIKNRRHKRGKITPMVSVIICTYNEAATIVRRINNLFETDYPKEKIEVIVVDSNSPDGTQEIMRTLIEQFPDLSLRLVTEDQRKGKVSAINLGLKAATGEIIMLTDSPALFWPDTIRLVVRNFADPEVGAVTGNFIKADPESTNYQQDTEWVVFNYRKWLRRLESNVDSTTWLSGELTAFRKSIIPKIEPDVIIDDTHLALKIREEGYRVVIDEAAGYAEKRPTTYAETYTIKIKSVTGSVKEMIRFRKLLFNPKYQNYGLFILPAKLLHNYLNPFIVIMLAISSIGLTWSYFGPGPIALAIGLGLLLLAAGWLYRRGKYLKPVIAFFLMEWIIIAGLFKYITGNYSANWKQVTTTRT